MAPEPGGQVGTPTQHFVSIFLTSKGLIDILSVVNRTHIYRRHGWVYLIGVWISIPIAPIYQKYFKM